MKKKMIILVLAIVIALSMAVPGLAAFDIETTPQHRAVTLKNPTAISFTGNSGTYYSITVASDIVGYNHITFGNKVKVCQAYTQITGGNPGGIDGIWGNNSESALRTAQTTLYNYGYTEVASDGVCGPYSWRGFYSYHYALLYPIPNALKNLL